MDMIASFSPQLVTIILFVVGLISIKLYSDIKEIAAAQHLRRLSASFVTKNNTPRISVVIDLNRSAETIFPLLDHLYSHKYANLEVVVAIRHTAGKHAQKKLAAYRRRNLHKQLKLVKHTKGMTPAALIHQNASGELIISLLADDTLSTNFFTDIALASLDAKADVIIPAQHTAMNTTIMSAMQTTKSVWKYIFTHLKATHTISGFQNGYIYRRSVLTHQTSVPAEYHAITAQQAAVVTTARVVTGRQVTRKSTKRLVRVTGKKILQLLAVFAVVGLLSFLSGYSFSLLAELSLISYVVIFAVFTFTIKEYSITEKTTLTLLAPFSILIAAILSVRIVLNYVFTAARNSTLLLKQRLLLTK